MHCAGFPAASQANRSPPGDPDRQTEHRHAGRGRHRAEQAGYRRCRCRCGITCDVAQTRVASAVQPPVRRRRRTGEKSGDPVRTVIPKPRQHTGGIGVHRPGSSCGPDSLVRVRGVRSSCRFRRIDQVLGRMPPVEPPADVHRLVVPSCGATGAPFTRPDLPDPFEEHPARRTFLAGDRTSAGRDLHRLSPGHRNPGPVPAKPAMSQAGPRYRGSGDRARSRCQERSLPCSPAGAGTRCRAPSGCGGRVSVHCRQHLIK